MRNFPFYFGLAFYLILSACGPDDDFGPQEPEVVIPNCLPPANPPDPFYLPSRLVWLAGDGDTTGSVVMQYDESLRLRQKQYQNGNVFTYYYGDEFNRIPDSILEVRTTEPPRLVTYQFSADCLPVREEYKLIFNGSPFPILLGGTDFVYDNGELISSFGQLNTATDDETSTYFRSANTGLVDSIIQVSNPDNLFGDNSERIYYTYTDIDNPYVVPDAMSYEDFFDSRLNSGTKMVRSITHDIVSRIQTIVLYNEYEYELDEAGRIKIVRVLPGGTSIHFIYP